MKIFISIDIEGIPGVVSFNHTRRDGKDYEKARNWMTEHLMDFIKALEQNEIFDVLVNDSHGGMTNLILDNVPENVNVIIGSPKKLSMVEGVGECDAAFFLGYHSRAGSFGVLDHTYFGRVVYNVRMNGRTYGEFGINAMLAGYFNVPVVLISGDNETLREAKSLIPEIETVLTKIRRGRFSAESFSSGYLKKQIEKKVSKAIKKFKENRIRPLKIKRNINVEVDFLNSGMADIAEIMPGSKRKSPRTLFYKAENIEEAFRAIRTWINLASTVI